jgi:1-deoxy-D-xylulose-5-phosphate reductoisomerase
MALSSAAVTTMPAARQVAVLGSTGSIGRSTLDVVRASGGKLAAVGLSAHKRVAELVEQAHAVRPRWIAVTDEQAAAELATSKLPAGCELLSGPDALEELAGRSEVEIVVAAIVGAAGLRSAWRAVECGKTLALANKETLVVAGPLVTERAAQSGATILPVDSEHSAIFQALAAGRKQDVKRLILTASGGPFRNYTTEQLQHVTIAEALAHPTWDMGRKISIDSATMMNKALEIIEARWLFDIPPEQIDVVIHPQSVVHSMVEFVDGSVVAQMSPPDMKLPIQYALSYPERWPSPAAKMDFGKAWKLEFLPPDAERFPALQLGFEVARLGGTAGAVVNAANEAAVAAFLAGELEFIEIVPACRAVLEQHHFDPRPTLDELLKLDRWAREEVTRWTCA